MKTNILNCIENYNKTLDINVCILFLKYIGLIHELIDNIAENIHIQKNNYLKHIIIKGIKNTTYIYTFLLLYTKNLELTIYHTQKSILYYVEFIGQLEENIHNVLKLNSTDATLFIYKKTIFDIDSDYIKQYIETSEIKEKMSYLGQYIDIYNNTMIQYIIKFDFNINNLNVFSKIVFTKFYNIVELLVQMPVVCKKTERIYMDELSKLNNIIYELNKYYNYPFIHVNYLHLIEYLIKKNYKKSINIDMFRKKLGEVEIENILNKLSVCKIGNYLSL